MTDLELKFQPSGFLEPGIVDLTLGQIFNAFAETPARFGLFQSFDSAIKALGEYKDDVRDIFVNGSFISTLPDPGDIDVLIITKTPDASVAISEQFWVLSLVGFDYNVYDQGSESAKGFIETYENVHARKYPGAVGTKGFVRLKHEWDD